MGLDSVELIMQLEDEFGLTIPDAVVERMQTVGDTIDYLAARLRERAAAQPGCPSARSFFALRRELMSRFGTPRRDIRPDSPIASLLPSTGRRQWPAVSAAAGLRRERQGLLRPQLPSHGTTIRGLIVTRCLAIGVDRDGRLDERAITDRVRRVVSDQTGVRLDEISRETRYVEDLPF
jgi:acyl carrier protein